MTSGQNTFIETTRIGTDSKIVEAICTKTPIHDENNNICGIFWSSTPLLQPNQQNIINSIHHSLFPVYGQQEQRLQVATSDLKHGLTTRELEVLFHTLHGKSAKAIAQRLKISPRTVEVHLANIKNKFACHTKQQLIDCAINEGYLKIIPDSLLPALS
ncbi:MAG: helix-turn-helix transcriptional regulator [Gammaproteobacteria bacterium]